MSAVRKEIPIHQPKLVTATNLFAHVDDIRGFLAAVRHCLRRDGALVLESPYLCEFLEHKEFDTVYFEHLSYVSLRPLIGLCRSLELEVFDVEPQDIHGGTVCVYVGHRGAWEVCAAVAAFVAEEQARKLDELETYLSWAREIDALVLDLTTQLQTLKRNGARIAAFGASAKGNTLLNVCRIQGSTIDYIVDDTPEKIGKFSPGTGIPIVSRAELQSSPPDYLVILAWNFAKEIMESNPELGQRGGQWIVPIPGFCIVSPDAK